MLLHSFQAISTKIARHLGRSQQQPIEWRANQATFLTIYSCSFRLTLGWKVGRATDRSRKIAAAKIIDGRMTSFAR